MRAILLLVAGILVMGPCRADGIPYPQTKVTLVTSASPGEGVDQFVRTLAAHLGTVMDVTFAVENIVGGHGREAIAKVASSPPDGSVIFVLTNDALKLSLRDRPGIQFDVLDPLAIMLYDPLVIFTGADTPWQTLAEFIDAARTNPGKAAWASEDRGSYAYLAMRKLAANAELNVSINTHETERDLALSVESGRADIGIGEIHEVGRRADEGKVRILATLTARRLRSRPQIPTAMEQGDVVISYQFRGIAGPKGMSDELAKTWHSALQKVSKLPAFKEDYARDSLTEHVMARTEARQAVDYLLRQLADDLAAAEAKTP